MKLNRPRNNIANRIANLKAPKSKSGQKFTVDETDICNSVEGEVSYLGRVEFALEKLPSCDQIISEFILPQFGHCVSHKGLAQILFVKSPHIVMQPWIA